MPRSIVRLFRVWLFRMHVPLCVPLRPALVAAALAAALILPWSAAAAGADERADLQVAFRLATAQYQVALKTLETRGREETAAEVSRLREAFQAVIQQFNADRIALNADQDYAGALMQLDVGIIGVLLVIDFGSREAAREALIPIGRTLAELAARAALRE
jgi:hypothetical protein